MDNGEISQPSTINSKCIRLETSQMHKYSHVWQTVEDMHNDGKYHRGAEEDVIESKLAFYDGSAIVLSHASTAVLFPIYLYIFFHLLSSACSLKCALQTHMMVSETFLCHNIQRLIIQRFIMVR